MNYKKCLTDALLLTEESSLEIIKIKELYNSSLQNKEIDNRLLVRIKVTLEHLRSSLDFVAQGLVLKYSPNNTKKSFFPYATLSTSKDEFIKKNKIENSIPNLSKERPDVASIIMAMQHFSHPGAKWFPEFMDLNNKNKHVHLVPQGLFQGVCLEFNGSKIITKSITLKNGASIQTRYGALNGPLTITPENVNSFKGHGIFKAEGWEGIFIDGYGFPMNSYKFVRHCVSAISTCVKQFNDLVP